MTDKPVSAFLTPKRTYLEELAHYLDDRGLTIDNIPTSPYYNKNMGLAFANGSPFVPEGWAYCLRGPDGQPRTGQWVVRVCNYPEDGVVIHRTKDNSVFEDRPKFIQCFKGEYLHYAQPRERIVAAKVVLLHEKVTSCELSAKLMNLASIAINGCSGWSRGGEIAPELASLIKALIPKCKLIVCFDGDITSNNNIYLTAGRLKGAVSALRPDIEVVFPMVPKNSAGVGWDDWVVSMGDAAPSLWFEELDKVGVVIDDVLPLEYLVQEYGISRTLKNKVVRMEQTQDNYLRLLRFPRWADTMVDLNGDVYRGGEYFGTEDAMFDSFFLWLERSVCHGHGDTVSKSRARGAFDGWLRTKRTSVVLELLRQQPEVTHDEATDSARRLVVEGLGVTGPMTLEEQVETVLRMFRDIALRWSTSIDVDVQWIWAIIGPSGCGKSMSSKFMFEGLEAIGYRSTIKSEVNKTHFKPEEETRKARDSLVMAVDDYNPSGNYARDVENGLYTLTSERAIRQREPYGRGTVEVVKRAIFFLSTTDQSRDFVRSAEGSGERRFIPMEIVGTTVVDGVVRVNREVLRKCGLSLLVWAAQGAVGVGAGQATEFSTKYMADYVQTSSVVNEFTFKRMDLEKAFKLWYREYTDDYRFSVDMLLKAFLIDRVTPAKRTDLTNLIVRCGAVKLGKGRVWESVGVEKQKDTVYMVKDMWAFLDELGAKF